MTQEQKINDPVKPFSGLPEVTEREIFEKCPYEEGTEKRWAWESGLNHQRSLAEPIIRGLKLDREWHALLFTVFRKKITELNAEIERLKTLVDDQAIKLGKQPKDNDSMEKKLEDEFLGGNRLPNWEQLFQHLVSARLELEKMKGENDRLKAENERLKAYLKGFEPFKTWNEEDDPRKERI